MGVKLKEEFLELLEKDKEFRYTILGYLGIGDVIKRLDFLAEELTKLREDLNEMRKEMTELRQEQVRMREEFGKRLDRVERTLEKLTLDIEEEAREVLEFRLREMGVDVRLERLELPELELDIYGVSGDVCVLGEATVRLGRARVEELARKVKRVSTKHPDLLRPKKVVVIYTSLATKDALREAERLKIWVVKATGDLTSPPELG